MLKTFLMKRNIFLNMVGNIFGISKCDTKKLLYLPILAANQETGNCYSVFVFLSFFRLFVLLQM